MRNLIIVSFLLTFLTNSAYGCQCEKPPSASEALKAADAVFVGIVVSGKMIEGDMRQYTFIVNDTLKGELKDKATVLTGRGLGECGFDFNIGRAYLVYANLHGNVLYTDICTRTKETPLHRETYIVEDENLP